MKDVMSNFSERICDALEESKKQKNLTWIKPWRTIDSKYRNAFSNNVYTGMQNILICAISDFSDCRFATFNQIRKNGGKVKKGSKATYLMAWNFVTKNIEDKSGNLKEETIPFAKKISLFNIEQTEGLNLPDTNESVLNKDNKPNETILKMFQDLKITTHLKKCNKAFYNTKTEEITVPHVELFENVDEWSGTCLHEMIHWTAPKLLRDCSSYHFDIEARVMEELVAEIGSMFLCMNLQINGHQDENSIAYISSWLDAARGKNGKRFIYKACKLAESACKYIMQECNMIEEKVKDEPSGKEAA